LVHLFTIYETTKSSPIIDSIVKTL